MMVLADDIAWPNLDGLTSRVENGELIIDTKVLESDVLKRAEELKKDPKAPAWEKTPVTDDRLDDCVGRINGVRLQSSPLSIKGIQFMFSSQLSGADGPFIYVEGFAQGKSVGKVFLKASGKAGRWIKNEKMVVFEKSAETAVIEIFCFRPEGEFRFRNISLKPGTAVSEKEVPENLVFNPGFEKGESGPEGWDGIDNLTAFCEKDEKGNRFIRLDTDVYKSDWEKRKEELEKNPEAAPWKKTPTKGPKYDTIGGTYGVSLWSRNIPVKKDTVYRLKVRMKGPCSGTEFIPKVFIKGYARVNGQYRKVYQAYKNCRDSAWKWTWHEREFSPAAQTPSVEYIKVQLYAYWPPGVYMFDDVSVVELRDKKPSFEKMPDKTEMQDEEEKEEKE